MRHIKTYESHGVANVHVAGGLTTTLQDETYLEANGTEWNKTEHIKTRGYRSTVLP